MSRRPMLAGNWKMHGNRVLAVELIDACVAAAVAEPERDVLVAPPFTLLDFAAEMIGGNPVLLAAQDVHWEAKGAFTGEVSLAMLQDVGCTAVILGHSERRHILGETNEMVNRKLKACLAAGLLPIVCVGELLEERNMGVTREVVERQISKGLEGLSPEDVAKIVIAYEPVWAIGTGKTATTQEAQDAHLYIRALVAKLFDDSVARRVRIQYGGSVKSANARELMSQPDVDGALVGGASLEDRSFADIVKNSI